MSILGLDKVRTRFEFERCVTDAVLIDRPSHVGDQPNPWRWGTAQQFVDNAKHRVLIELTSAKIRLCPGSHVALSALEQRGHIKPTTSQVSHQVCPFCRVDKIYRPLAARKPLAHERVENAMLFVIAVDEGADVPIRVEYPARKRGGRWCISVGLGHADPLHSRRDNNEER